MVINKGRGYTYYILYYLVWALHEKNTICIDDLQEQIYSLIQETCGKQGIKVNSITYQGNIIILEMECSPQHYIPDIVKALKGNTARFILRDNVDLKNSLWGGHLWNPNYFITTCKQCLEKYIKDLGGN